MTRRSWVRPTPEMRAALRLARQCAARHGLTEIQTAEWVMEAHASLWYLQASTWAEQPPAAVVDTARPVFQQGCRAIVQIVDLGYDGATDQWWPLRTLWPGEAEWGEVQLVLMDTGLMLKRLPDVALWPAGTYEEEVLLGTAQRAFTAVSAGFGIFLSIVCGPRWEQRFRAMMLALRQRPGFPPPRRGRAW